VQRYNQHHVIDIKSKPVYKQLKRTSADVRHRCVQLQSADQLSTVEVCSVLLAVGCMLAYNTKECTKFVVIDVLILLPY
jgi:hypothetical protein